MYKTYWVAFRIKKDVLGSTYDYDFVEERKKSYAEQIGVKIMEDAKILEKTDRNGDLKVIMEFNVLDRKQKQILDDIMENPPVSITIGQEGFTVTPEPTNDGIKEAISWLNRVDESYVADGAHKHIELAIGALRQMEWYIEYKKKANENGWDAK